MSIDYEKLAERIHQLRLERGLTQEQLAEYAGLSTHYIGNIEQGARHPSLGSIMLLCGALGVTPNDLFVDSISDKMRAGLCVPISDDPNALRDSMAALSNLFGDYFPLEDEESSTLFGIPVRLLPKAPEQERFISLSELLHSEENE